MGKIAVLDRNMVNMIAAGEVIERPASVVKELLENSIDAGAKNITLEVEDGGRKLVKVIDDGCGMDSDDLSKAFLPHATSKIKGLDDLLKIATMGFRGEALASIGSIAKVSITSRLDDAIEANRVDIDCGEDQNIRPTSGTCGTTIEVRDLFYKLPARRKFLRTVNTEFGHISEQFTRIALARRGIGLVLVHNGREVYRLSSGQGLEQRIRKLFTGTVADDLLEINSQEKGVDIYGMIGTPAAARANGKYLYVFLNGRYIRDKFISHALRESYRGLIEHNKYPVAFLFLKMAGDAFDVNVHPTKVEVRFDNSNLVHSQVMAVVRERLMGLNVEVRADIAAFRPEDMVSPSSGREERIKDAISDFFEKHKRSDASQGNFSFAKSSGSSGSGAGGRESYRQDFYKPVGDSSQPLEPGGFEKTRVLQVHNSYILVQTEDGFAVIDQHALHERILYEKMFAGIKSSGLESQRLLMPCSFDVNAGQKQLIDDNQNFFVKLGIEIEEFGPGVMAVQAFPTMLNGVEPGEFIAELLDILADNEVGIEIEQILHQVLDMAACKAAIKAGKSLSEDEIFELLTQKEQAERSSNCPHGRPTTIRFSLSELEKQFKRT